MTAVCCSLCQVDQVFLAHGSSKMQLVHAHPSERTDLVGQSLIGQYCTQLMAHDTQQTTVFIRGNNGGNPEPSSISMIQAHIVSHNISLTLVATCMCENKSGECPMTITLGEIILCKKFPTLHSRQRVYWSCQFVCLSPWRNSPCRICTANHRTALNVHI